jgi:hypothetical protein
MPRTLSFLLASLALLVSWTPALPASDPGAIGLGLEKLHMHMSMAEARRAYPRLIDWNSHPVTMLGLRPHSLEGCEFSVVLFFTNNALTQIDLDARDAVGLTHNIDVCTPAILKRLEEQYGAAQPPPRHYSGAVYFKSNNIIEISASDAIGGGGGLVDVNGRYLDIEFHARGTPLVIAQ